MFQTVLIITALATIAAGDLEPDFVWRDYDGQIPNDAFQAGTDKKGALYVGQVVHNNSLIPGKIYRNDPNIYFEFGQRAYSTHKNIQIFCTKKSADYYWYPYTVSNFQNLKRFKIVNGGYQQGFDTFIGKVVEQGDTDVGKVICRTDSCLGLYTSKDGLSKVYRIFNVLIYYPRSQ